MIIFAATQPLTATKLPKGPWALPTGAEPNRLTPTNKNVASDQSKLERLHILTEQVQLLTADIERCEMAISALKDKKLHCTRAEQELALLKDWQKKVMITIAQLKKTLATLQ